MGPDGGRYICDAQMPLSQALDKTWEQDAHLLQYHLVDESGEQIFARANKLGAPIGHQLAKAGGRIASTIICLDHDLPEHREWANPQEPLDWLAAVPPDFPQPTVWYSTLHGSRLLYVLTAPVDRLEAEALARALLVSWRTLTGSELLGAASCADWTRMFRLPRTKRSDSGLPFWQSDAFYIIEGGPELDPARLPHDPAPAQGTPEFAAVTYGGSMPDAEECRAELEVAGVSGRGKLSEFSKDARRMLKGRESFGVAFEDAKFDPARLEQGWNNTVLFYVGQVTSMLAGCASATPEGCFALLRPALEQLSADDQDHKDWLATGWDMTSRMWGIEVAKIASEKAAREASVREGQAVVEEIAITLRAALPEEIPSEPEAAREHVARRMIASDGRHHYVMRRDGSYNLSAVGDSMLIPMIRELGMEDAIPVRVLRGHNLVYRSTSDLLAEHAVPVAQVRCSAREKASHVDGQQGERTLRVPIHRLNPRLSPAHSPDVDEWLQVFFGRHYEQGLDWLAHALEVASPICAINLYGASSSGKGMLCQGVSECFEKEAPNDGRAMDRFNIGLLRSPVIWCDEGVPQVKSLGSTADEVFRQLVAGGTMQIEGKMRDVIVADLYPRLIFASNDRDIMRAIVGHRDLTEESVRAIEQRLLSIPVGPEARRFLAAKGNYDFTRGWVAGDQPSRYVLANHIAFLHATRKPSRESTGRFLVEGESRTELVRDLRLRSDAAQAVLRALARMLESQALRDGMHTAEGRVWVTTSCVTDYMELQALGQKVTMPQVGQVLRQFAVGRANAEEYVPVFQPPGATRRGRWIELDLAALLEHCQTYGMASTRIESLLKLQEGGAGAVVEAKMAAAATTKQKVGS